MGEYKYRNSYLFGVQDPWMELWPLYLKCVALLFAVAMTFLTFYIAWRTFCSTRATITSPYTETANGTITKLNLKRMPQNFSTTPRLCVELEYVYKVEGQEFTAMRYRPTDSGPISSLAVPELLKNCRLGDSVVVFIIRQISQTQSLSLCT